ncbi:MerR family transcriptional regulator [Streptomyces sp. SYP-A7185]|uniref:MerR family transcriptional regulator n=1 Tax=Streptomyces sp. SYP-A7185 TaxID=3040076 RepID=UPI0038F73282
MERIPELTLRDEPREPDYPDAEVLLTIVNAERHCRPVPVQHVERDGRVPTQSTYSVAVVFLRAVAAVRLPVTAAAETVRHHHKLGLLEEPERAPSSYKRYDVRHLVRLMGIRRLTDLGVPLSDIPTVAAADARSKEILRALDAELAANIERQQHMRRQLAAILEDGASLGPPAGFGAAAATLPQAQQDLLVAS